MRESRIPVDIITGFLGSGKTTLLNHILASPFAANSAVLVNELGEVGIDHHLIREVQGDVMLLQSGCVCCSIRGDLAAAIRDLHNRRDRGEIPAYGRLLIETTGLADPGPVLQTVARETVIQHHYRIGQVVATVDAVLGLDQLERQPETAAQVAIADCVVLTKLDMTDAQPGRRLMARLRRINAGARYHAEAGRLPKPEYVLDAADDPKGIDHWLEAAAAASVRPARHAAIQTLSLVLETAVDWAAFGVWLTMLLHRHGQDVLRVKALLDVGTDRPLMLHAVQHLVHPPVHLQRWPDHDRRSRLVFILRGLEPRAVRRSFLAFQRLAFQPT